MWANWSYPTEIRFGAGRISELASACREAGILSPLIVTDAFLARQPIALRAIEVLRSNGIEPGLFGEVRANPVESNVVAGVAAFKAGGHDGVIAFGGGSSMDAGKVIAFMVGQDRPVMDFALGAGDLWRAANVEKIAPYIAVPTTSGTGSEVGRGGVITRESTHTKEVIAHPLLWAKVVICDPELAIGMPAKVTAGTGMDALVHCVEAFCTAAYHPMSEGIAAEGTRLIFEYLPQAYEDGNDITARGQMMAAAAMGAVAFAKGLGGVHALAHPIGAVYDTPHGMTNATLLPYVLAFNRPVIEKKIGRLAGWCGLEPHFDAFMEAVVALRRRLDVPHTLSDLGIPGDRVQDLARAAAADVEAGGNPLPFDEAAARAVLDAAFAGRI